LALAETLRSVTEPEYVRFVAHWITHADQLDAVPALTCHPVIDALVAAAAAHAALLQGIPAPSWTNEPARALDRLWHPGPAGFFAHALVHSPLAFTNRGILVEADSLASV
jgi:hypothetical protein